ncbi:hypothetical protein E2C01_071032 [Portunus trituberculatus]|uniref:Uncharacterized protein n=1 Tax=Portunus trituberculatus TaxID=210409 RepID=A0A5B7I389_PORTR|nr:hypothetical protein [Portunus trituberculatus]
MLEFNKDLLAKSRNGSEAMAGGDMAGGTHEGASNVSLDLITPEDETRRSFLTVFLIVRLSRCGSQFLITHLISAFA